MKVLMIGNHPSVKGGITSVITQLLRHDWEKENVDMKFIPTYIETNTSRKSLYFLISYLRIVISMIVFRPDVIHIHMSYKGSFFRKYLIHKLCKFFRRKDIIHLHGSEFYKFFEEANSSTRVRIQRLLRECNSMIVLGDEWNKKIKEIEPSVKTVVVGNTVKIPNEVANWNENNFQILFLGVLIKRKGVHNLIKAAKMMKDNGEIRKIKIVIAGSGIEEVALKKMCEEFQLDDVVEFVGWTDGQKKKDLMKQSQLLILPSYNEGLPISILEAISLGIPVIASPVGDIPTSVKNGENGFLVDPEDIEKIVNCLYLISSNRELWNKLSRNAKKLAIEKFSEEKYFLSIIECYKNILKAD